MRKFLILTAVISIALSGCKPKTDKKEAIEFLCAYQQHLVVLNDGMTTFKGTAMRAAYRVSNHPDDQDIINLSMDSITNAADAYSTLVDKSAGELQQIKAINDKSKLIEKTVNELHAMSEFCKKDFKGYCMEAKDSLGTGGPWMEKWMPSFKRIADTGEKLAEYQVAFGDEFKLNEEDYKALYKCQSK